MYSTHIKAEYRSGMGIALASLALFIGSTFTANAAVTGTLLPTSDGTYTAWTPSAGVTHFTLVDEAPCNGTTDYVWTKGAGNRDSFGVSLSSVPLGATITNISIVPCASRDANGGGSSVLNVFYRYNGVNSSDQGSYALTGTTPVSLGASTWSGLSFVKTSTSTLEIGAVYTSGTKGARVSRIGTVLTYTPPPPTVTTSSSTIFTGTTTLSGFLTGFGNPNGATSTGWFRYDTVDPGTCNDTFGTRAPGMGGVALGTGTVPVYFEEFIDNLLPATTYYYCALASNVSGIGMGGVQAFVTP